jgi:hypothetical protein
MDGKQQYDAMCAGCHGANGMGTIPVLPFPSVCGAKQVDCSTQDKLISYIAAYMPDQTGKCNDQCSTAIVNYLRTLAVTPPVGDPNDSSMLSALDQNSYNDLFDDVELASAELTLRQTSLIIQGRLPTAAQMKPIKDKGEAGLDEAISLLLKTPEFLNFVADMYAKDFNIKDRNNGAGNQDIFFGIASEYAGTTQADYKKDFHDIVKKSMGRAPFELIKYIVKNNRPITELVTANYTMVNYHTAKVFMLDETQPTLFNQLDQNNPDLFVSARFARQQLGGTFAFHTDVTPSYWTYNFDPTKKVDFPKDYNNGTYPHSGLLTEFMWMNNWTFSGTNLFRVHAANVLREFLDFDILKINVESVPAGKEGFAPTLNNPNCTVCHRIIDPIAASFLQHSDMKFNLTKSLLAKDRLWEPGYYNLNTNAYLKYPTRTNRIFIDKVLYEAGTQLPDNENPLPADEKNPLQFLGKRIAEDDRFLPAQIGVVYRSLMGHDILRKENKEMTDDEVTAYRAQQRLFQNIVEAMTNNPNDPLTFKNIKVAFSMLINSPQFRAQGLKNSSNFEVHAETGRSRLLPVDVMHKKIYDILGGVTWQPTLDRVYNEYLTTNKLNTVTTPVYPSQLTSNRTLYNVPSIHESKYSTAVSVGSVIMQQQLSADVSCAAVPWDFWEKDASKRRLFKYVETTTLPFLPNDIDQEDVNGLDKIKQNIGHLYEHILGERNPSEEKVAFDLFISALKSGYQQQIQSNRLLSCPLHQDRLPMLANGAAPLKADVDSFNKDPNFTMHAWGITLQYILSDPTFYYDNLYQKIEDPNSNGLQI